MVTNSLHSISPVDGRYINKTAPLQEYFSEFALIKYRVKVEILYFIALTEANCPELKGFPKDKTDVLHKIYTNFDLAQAEQIKQIEKVTNHDVKAVEYFIKEQFDALNLSEYKEFIHFGLTSQDINNTAIPLSIKEGVETVLLPSIEEIIQKLNALAKEWKNVPMLARTHGQAASPTLLGKEVMVFVERLNHQKTILQKFEYSAKLGGATGNFNAHHIAYPEIDWIAFANGFVKNKLRLNRQQFTTQIEHYDGLAELFQTFQRINNICIDFCRDFWTYISMDYFKQKIKPNEVGSSAMPHKVNPIDFENAEGNLALANSVFSFLANKLPISRLQRDLTDSTVLRNVGVPFAHSLISYQSMLVGLNKLILNSNKIHQDLDQNWAVIAEAIQTFLRKKNYPNPYETLKELTRKNEQINQETIHVFIDSLSLSNEDKEYLKTITPFTYTGVCLPF